MNHKTKNLVLTALLTAVCLVFGLTSLGYIPIGPIQITLMCIPVVIGTLTLGLKYGIFLGAVFAVTSIAQIFIAPSPLYAVLFTDFLSWCKIIVVCIVPRLLVPIAAHYACRGMFRLTHGAKKPLGWAVSSAVGSLTNTVFFLGLFWLLFSGTVSSLTDEMQALYYSMFTFATTVNAGAELLFACIVCPPILLALRKLYRTES